MHGTYITQYESRKKLLVENICYVLLYASITLL